MKYRLSFPIRSVHGTQTFLVEATSKIDALVQHEAGKSTFEGEEVDIMGLGEPEIDEVDRILGKGHYQDDLVAVITPATRDRGQP